jgi:hypothetical protein
MTMHMSFAKRRGMGSYTVLNDQGQELPIGYQYDTREGGQTGFFIVGREKCSPVMSWSRLCEVWPRFLEKRSAADMEKA